MFESFIIALREGIEVALIVGLIWVYLRNTERTALIRAVLWGLGAGVAISVGIAVGIRMMDFSSAIVEGTLMLIAAAFIATMIVWMLKNAKGVSAQIKNKVDQAAEKPTTTGAFVGILLLTAVMVAREGFETVLFLAAIWKAAEGAGSSMALSYVGVAAGLALAIGFAVAFIRGSVHIDLARFFKITGAVLGIFLVQVVIYGLHEYDEAGLMRWAPHEMMEGINAIAANNVLFVLAIVAIPILMLLIPGRNAGESTPRERTFRMGGAVAGFVVLAAIGGQYLSVKVQAAQSEHPVLHASAGKIELYLSSIEMNKPMRFDVPEDGAIIPLFAVRDDAGVLHLATTHHHISAGDHIELREGKLVLVESDGEVEGMADVPFELEEEDEAYIDVHELEELYEHS